MNVTQHAFIRTTTVMRTCPPIVTIITLLISEKPIASYYVLL